MSIVAFDVDGVVADLHTPWLKRYNKEYKDNLQAKDITHWEMQKFVKSQCTNICKYLDPTIYSEVLPIPGALKAVNIARKEGHRVIFVTSVLTIQAGMKFTWLNEHGFDVQRHDYVEAKDKSLIKADLLIDDYEGNLETFDGSRALFSQPWNQHINDFYRINEFNEDFNQHLLNLLDETHDIIYYDILNRRELL
jgi:5'(3')-deoxyribonucleotidase